MIRLVLAFSGNSTNADPADVVYCGHSASAGQKAIDAYQGKDELRIAEVPHLRRAKKTRVQETAQTPAAPESAEDRAKRREEFIAKAKGDASEADPNFTKKELAAIADKAGAQFDSENPE